MCDLADRPSLYEQAPARRTGASDLAPYAQARTFLTDTYARRRNAVDCSVVDSAGTPPVPPTTVPCARQGLGIMQAWMQTERSRNWAHRVSLLAPGAAFLGEHHAVARLCRDVLPHVHHPFSMHLILLRVPRVCRPNSRLGCHHRRTLTAGMRQRRNGGAPDRTDWRSEAPLRFRVPRPSPRGCRA